MANLARDLTVGTDPADGPTHPHDLDELRVQLTTLMTPGLDALDPIPHATVEQARRVAALRARLLATGAVRYEDIAEVRDAATATVRQSVHRAVKRHQLFTVSHDGKTLIPVFQLDEAFFPRPELRPVLRPLQEAGEDGWALWTWFATPSAWLDGRPPVDVLTERPDDVAEAARRRASNAA